MMLKTIMVSDKIVNKNMIVLIVLLLFCIFKTSIGMIDYPQKEKTKLALIGDSNSLRLSVLFENNLSCRRTTDEQQVEGHVPTLEYWNRNGKITGLVVHNRDCAGCNARSAVCDKKVSHIEYVTMEYVMDTVYNTISAP